MSAKRLTQSHGNLTLAESFCTVQTMKTYKYYDFIMAAFVCVLLCSNLIGAAKAAEFELPWLDRKSTRLNSSHT